MTVCLTGIGIDVVYKPRMARFIDALRFLEKVCGEDELEWIPRTVDGISMTWGAKEAIAKTLGTGFWQAGVDWKDIALKPDWCVEFKGRALDIAKNSEIRLRFEHELDYLTVTAERWKPC